MTYADTARQIIKDSHPDWEVEDDSVLRCPCGYLVEYDGSCPEGHVSPFRELGLI